MAVWVYLLDLKDDPALIAQYEEWHKAVWPEVLDHLRSIGFRSCRIDRAGNRLVMLVESDGPVASDGGGGEVSPRVQEWEAIMDAYQQRLPFATEGQKWVLASTIFDWHI
ncbi:MAG: L-rhamnose mutarotase [Armatimonadetes bacterium]|nr:L-rhamnose mutarotase [Armatimonadota bacterium]